MQTVLYSRSDHGAAWRWDLPAPSQNGPILLTRDRVIPRCELHSWTQFKTWGDA